MCVYVHVCICVCMHVCFVLCEHKCVCVLYGDLPSMHVFLNIAGSKMDAFNCTSPIIITDCNVICESALYHLSP